ncbi:MAG: SulP family inorganic anion transporter [Polyangiaceae bacterium]
MRAGTVIKYIPYPVVTGYLSGVAVVIALKQLPSLLGLAKNVSLGHGVVTPADVAMACPSSSAPSRCS